MQKSTMKNRENSTKICFFILKNERIFIGQCRWFSSIASYTKEELCYIHVHFFFIQNKSVLNFWSYPVLNQNFHLNVFCFNRFPSKNYLMMRQKSIIKYTRRAYASLHKIERSNVTWKYLFDTVKKILIISVFYNSIHA